MDKGGPFTRPVPSLEAFVEYFQSRFTVLTSDCDRFGFWRPDSMMLLMQELAGRHSHSLGWGQRATIASGAVWVLTRHEMAIDRYPEPAYDVIGKTVTGRPRRGIYTRYYRIEDLEGRTLVRASSFWVLADIQTRRMADRPDIAAVMPEGEPENPPLARPCAAQDVAGGEERKTSLLPVYTDIDHNGHVNNTRAAAWALCMLAERASLGETPVKSLCVNYLREIRAEDAVDLAFRFSEPDFSLRCECAGEAAVRLSGTLFGPGEAPRPDTAGHTF